jgi:hypothetical protein
MVRANRYALAAAQDGVALEPSVRALHGCDNTVCVRVSRPGETGLLHVVGGTQRDNMEMMGRARRGGGRPAVRRGMAGLAQRRARAVALRRAVRDGWDAEAVAQALLTLRETDAVVTPGVGASETPVVPYSMPRLADVTARTLDAVGIAKADVVGFSHGGAVAQQMAIGYPTRVDRLVLLATACGVGAVPGRGRDVTRLLLTPNRATRWPKPDPLGLLWQIVVISTLSSIPVLGCIAAPTLVVCGDHDTAVPPANSYLLGASATPASSLSRPDTIRKSPAPRPLRPSSWSRFSIRKLR